MLFENPLAEALRGSFRTWGESHPTYKLTYKKMNESCLRLADIALGELDNYAPGTLWTWYTRHHMRFYKMKNVDVRYTIELLQSFLADYAHGRLRRNGSTTSTTSITSEIKNKTRPQIDRPDRNDETCGLPVNRSTKKSSD